MTMAESYARDQSADRGVPLVDVPDGARCVVSIVLFDDDSVFVGSPAVTLDEDTIIEAVRAAADLYEIGDGSSAELCGLHTPLDVFSPTAGEQQ